MLLHILELLASSLREAGEMFWATLWALALGFALSGVVQSQVSRRGVGRWLGDAGPASLLRATAFGAASSSCSYAAAAIAKALFARGASFVAANVFMFASTNLVLELGLVLAVLVGWQFALAELLGGLVMVALFSGLARLTLSGPAIARARARLSAPDGNGPPQAVLEGLPWRQRLSSGVAWRAAAGYALADLRMLRKEILGGFLVGGLLATLVPEGAWRALFLSGHGLGTNLENAAVGPLIAMLSLVCSVGNAPLAAALWKGGIGFGGVASFIYGDLITLPLVLIYRRYYGSRLTLRLVGTFWLVMAAAGLAVQYLFQWLGALPQPHPGPVASHAFGLDWTSALDILALLLLGAALLWVRRQRPELAQAGYASDPVCGMQVERATAPATLNFEGREIYFCSDRCRDRFHRDPGAFGQVPSRPVSTISSTRR